MLLKKKIIARKRFDKVIIAQVLDVPRIAAVKPIIFGNNARQGLVEKIVIKQKEKEDEKVSNEFSTNNSVKCKFLFLNCLSLKVLF